MRGSGGTMDEKDWHMLKALYEEGSITKASEALYVSQPALTKRIKQIENDFQVKIISRSSKGIRFTIEGEYLVNYSIKMLNTIQKVRDTLINMASNTVEGTLRLGVSINFAYDHLPRILKHFSDKFPKVKTNITTGYSSDIIKMFHAEKFQIAIVRGDFHWKGPKRHIKTENICLVSKEKIDIERIPELPRIEYKTDPLLKIHLENWWKEKYSSPPLIAMEVDNSQTCVGMVSQGLGYAILPRFSLESGNEDLYVENLLNSDGELLMRDTWIIYHEQEIELSAVREFVSFMEENLDTKSI
jgi:DNA-binding transcriptional LysR family regulator